jgi:hemerythrin-like domain-containing protein
MYMVHTMFRREFTLMPALVRGVATDDTERSQLVTEHIALVNDILHHHHEAEDKHLWPRLLARGSEEVASVVHLCESQHETIEKLRAELELAVEAWRKSATSERRQGVADAAQRMLPPLIDHMNVEESRILPLVEKYITASEWDTMVKDAAADVPEQTLALAFGMMLYEGDPEVVGNALSRMPEEARPIIQRAASQAFASHSERVYGTPTPPRSKASA